MLTDSEVSRLKEELLSCQRPLFIFHDDPDGLASFLLCYRFVREGRGIPVKAYPRITVENYARKVEEFGADKVFGRGIVEEHMEACLDANLAIYGINAEVMPGQWEYQIGASDALTTADHLILARWLLARLGEKYGIEV